MQIKFKSTELCEAVFLSREVIVAWLEDNGWVATPMQKDWYWQTWRSPKNRHFWVNVPAPEDTNFGYKLPDDVKVKQQQEMFETLQTFTDKPAMDIYREMVGDTTVSCKLLLLTEFWNSVGEDTEEEISGVNFSDFEEIIRIMSNADAKDYWQSIKENYDAEGRSAVLEVICERFSEV